MHNTMSVEQFFMLEEDVIHPKTGEKLYSKDDMLTPAQISQLCFYHGVSIVKSISIFAYEKPTVQHVREVLEIK